MMKYYFVLLIFISTAYSNELKVKILNRKNSSSIIKCGMFSSGEGFPMNEEKAIEKVIGFINEKNETYCVFKNVAVARFALSVFEDLNHNGIFDKSFVGYPKEPWGVSRNAPMHTFGPPKFDEALIDYSDKVGEIELH